jgi:hypothetical protein
MPMVLGFALACAGVASGQTALPPAAPPAPGGAGTEAGGGTISSLTRVLRTGIRDLLAASRNREFLEARLTPDRLAALRDHLGRDLVERTLSLDGLEGKTVRDLVDRHPEIASSYPQVIASLAAIQRRQGVRLYGNDRDPRPLDVASPGRIVPVEDLVRAVGRSEEPGERVREYLRTNFSLDETQLRGYEAFLAQAGRDARASDGPGALAAIARRAATAPTGSGPRAGLYLPAGDVLSRIGRLVAFEQSYAREADADPARFRGPDGSTLADLLAELESDPDRRAAGSDVRGLTPAGVAEQIRGLVARLVATDVGENNRFLFEMGLASVSDPGQSRAQAERAVRPAAQRGAGPRRRRTVGSAQVKELNDALYKTLILDDLRPSQRDRAELDSDGEVFSIRGRPGDAHQKHYDPPSDAESLMHGIGMNLDNARDTGR